MQGQRCCWRRRRRRKRERVRVAGEGRRYVDVAGTGGETAGGEVVSK